MRLARDLCGTNPERMAPLKFGAYVQAACRGTAVKVTINKDKAKLEKGYPLLMARATARVSCAWNTSRRARSRAPSCWPARV